jgi:hypothetical protein
MEFYESLRLFLYENEFQNPQIFQQTISLFPEHSTLEMQFLCDAALFPSHPRSSRTTAEQ